MEYSFLRSRHSWKGFMLWFFCTYCIFGPILTFLRSLDASLDALKAIFTFPSVFFINSLLCFFFFSFLAYQSFYHFFSKRKILLFFSLSASLIIPIALRFFIDQKVALWGIGYTNYALNTTFKDYYVDNTYFAVYYIPAGVLYYFYIRILELQAIRLEEEKLRNEAEMLHLRSQINPHFLFNSLNNIYSLAYDKSDKILGTIEGLSELLRYAIYEKAEKVTFKKEWSKILQLIDIEHLRIGNPVAFEIDLEEDLNDLKIPPIILMPLIENVFKHGDLQSVESPPKIKVWREHNRLNFKITNKVRPTLQKDGNKGIGLTNIRKRLLHIYGDVARFEDYENQNTFTVQIGIPIDD